MSLVELLNENLKQPHESVQAAAARALRHVLHVFFGGSAAPSERLRKLTVLAYVDLLRSSANVACTRGAALALGPIDHHIQWQPACGLHYQLLTVLLLLFCYRCFADKSAAALRGGLGAVGAIKSHAGRGAVAAGRSLLFAQGVRRLARQRDAPQLCRGYR